MKRHWIPITTLSKRLAILLSSLVAVAAASFQPASAQDSQPCSSEPYRQFDFWLGEWRVETPQGQEAGRNTVSKTLGNCVVEENWRGASGANGRSFNMFFARDGKWHQTWVDGSGGRLDLAGGWADGKMTMSGVMPGPDDKPVLHEISWTPLPNGDVRQHWRASADQKQSWNDVFVGIYKRVE